MLNDYCQCWSAFILTASPQRSVWSWSCRLTNIPVVLNQGRKVILSIHLTKDQCQTKMSFIVTCMVLHSYDKLHYEGTEEDKQYWLKTLYNKSLFCNCKLRWLCFYLKKNYFANEEKFYYYDGTIIHDKTPITKWILAESRSQHIEAITSNLNCLPWTWLCCSG